MNIIEQEMGLFGYVDGRVLVNLDYRPASDDLAAVVNGALKDAPFKPEYVVTQSNFGNRIREFEYLPLFDRYSPLQTNIEENREASIPSYEIAGQLTFPFGYNNQHAA